MKPYVCPVCGGNGLVQEGFYRQVSGSWISSDISFEKCRSCKGKGIIWGEDEISYGPMPETPKVAIKGE